MNTYVIARMTYREGARQPLLYVILGVSGILIFIAPLFSLFAFGEEISMVREVGLATITFAGLLIAVLLAYLLLTAEIEKLTVLTTLSKPISRSEFIVGKFLGIFYTCFLTMLFLGLILSLVYWLNEGRSILQTGLWEGRYLNHPERVAQDITRFLGQEVGLILKGVYACLLQVMILASFAILFSSRVSLVISALGCFMVFVLGHISNYLSLGLIKSQNIIWISLGRMINLIIPNLTDFNVSSLVADRYPISLSYLLATTLYAVVYSTIILTITCLLFGRREIK